MLGFVSWWLQRSVVRPLRTTSSALNAARDGDVTVTVTARTQDEVRQIATAANALLAMSWVARVVCSARSLTSPATTANPLPACPARAASIAAFRARRFAGPDALGRRVHHLGVVVAHEGGAVA